MQKNWRTEYFKNLIKDKTRTKRWRKVLLCLSCVVVFWTVYALILPAITLESKKCNIEEHTHSAECYSESQELICGKEEHVHTAECTSINNDLSDSGEEAGTVPDASGNDANGNEEGKLGQPAGVFTDLSRFGHRIGELVGVPVQAGEIRRIRLFAGLCDYCDHRRLRGYAG